MRAVAILLCTLMVAACGRKPPVKTTEFYGNVMTIDYRIVIGTALSEEQKQRVQGIIADTFAEVNTLYNKWNPNSELSRLNRMPAGEILEISPQLTQLLKLTEKVVALTEGRFDPTIEPLQALWKKSPSDKEIAALMPSIGWDNVHVGEGIFSKDADNLMIDLGGIAKGYAVDLLVKNLVAEQFPSIYVEWGGEIKTVGKHPHKRPWRVFISRLDDTNVNNALAIVDLEDKALATSGDYLQKWQVGEIEYFHVMNPKTGYPYKIREDSIASASIACESCALADGLATAAMTYESKEDAEKWLESLRHEIPDLQFWLYTRKDCAKN
jgi:thiamine biosynthesis lipoprotein